MNSAEPGRLRVAFRGMLGRFALDASFDIPASGVTALFGASGCGKTTVLRCIAGLERLPEGFCSVDDEIWQDHNSFRPPHQRAIGYVFQEASLFPHLSVMRNLLYGAPRAVATLTSGSFAFDETIDLLGLEKLLDRSPQNLSGGERQRVAIGRALLSQPKLLLMDEPLSALDRLTKDEILPFLERLHARSSLPVIYVSHDMSEVERLADHLVLMHAGKVVATGLLSQLQSDPSLPLSASRDAAVSLDGAVEAHDATYGILTLRIDGATLMLPGAPSQPGERRRVRIPAGDVSLAREPPRASTILNSLPGRVVSKTDVGDHEIIAVVALGPEGTGAKLLSRVTRRSWETIGLMEGMSVYAQIKGVSLAFK